MPLECCGCRDPWPCRCHADRNADTTAGNAEFVRPIPFVMLSAALGALRRAWPHADDTDRLTLINLAAVLTELAEVS